MESKYSNFLAYC